MSNDLQFRLSITCENAAFEDSPESEIARILRVTADRLENGDDFDTYRNLLDLNGNVVGTAALKTREEHDGGRWHDRKARRAASALFMAALLSLVTCPELADALEFLVQRAADWHEQGVTPSAPFDSFPAVRQARAALLKAGR